MSTKRIAIFTGGVAPYLAEETKKHIKQIARECQAIFAADGGADHLFRLDILPSLVLGDMDSATSETLLWLKEHRVEVRRFSVEKDLSDLELCIEEAARLKYDEAVIFFALGGRVDHTLFNIFCAFNDTFSGIRLKFFDGDTTIIPLKGSDRVDLELEVGTLLSLIPLSETVSDVSLAGVKWPLNRNNLSMGKSLTLSNEVVSSPVSLSISAGKLLLIHHCKAL